MAIVLFVVGNTYDRIPHHEADRDRSGRYAKIHDWTLYVDIIAGGNPDLIHRVTFDLGPSFSPSCFVKTCPIQRKLRNGKTVWRFCTRQQSFAPLQATITLLGAGGTRKDVPYAVQLQDHTAGPYKFLEQRTPIRPMTMNKVPPDQRFGIELELTSAPTISPTTLANVLNDALNGTTHVQVIHNYHEGRTTSTTNWKLVPDSSIVCNISVPDCNTFELVSPILEGGYGLSQISRITNVMNNQIAPKLKVNKSMGFHVHIDVSQLRLDELIKICQNFVKYEDVIDTFMPPSRRTGSPESNQYFQSNRMSITMATNARNNRQRNLALSYVDTMEDLANLINADNWNGNRYYKLNMQNLLSGRQPTLEFRQHSATTNYQKLSAWIRFCIAFCQNSAAFPPPTAFKEGRSLDYQFQALFHYVIKDRALRDFYRARIQEVKEAASSSSSSSCCHGCSTSGICNRYQ